MNDTTTNDTDCPADYWDDHCSRCSDELEGGRDATLCKECSREIEMKRRERGDRCERCDGHGYIHGTICDLQRAANGRDTLCPECHGSGRVPYEPDDGRLVPDGGQVEDSTEHTECAVCGYEPDSDRVPPHYVLSLSDEDTDGKFVQSYPFGGPLFVPFACSDGCWLDAQDDPELIADGGTVEDDTDRIECVECGKDLTDPENCGDPDVGGDWVCADDNCRIMHEPEMTVQRRVIRS